MHYDSLGFLDFVLSHPLQFDWSVQGLGMLRFYLNDTDRLSIWHNDFRVPDASPIHDHYWGFQSFILCGELRNVMFERHVLGGEPMNRWRIVTGEETVVLEGPEQDFLKIKSSKTYGPGDWYSQRPQDIHRTEFEDGTVTVIRRTEYLEERDRANVWDYPDKGYVTARPRVAKYDEILKGCEMAKRQLERRREWLRQTCP